MINRYLNYDSSIVVNVIALNKYVTCLLCFILKLHLYVIDIANYRYYFDQQSDVCADVFKHSIA